MINLPLLPNYCKTDVSGRCGLNVLSLFDGMSCGQIALEKAGIKYLSQLENGHKQASTEVLQGIATFCEVPLAILFWFTIEEKEVRKNKKEAFKLLKPCIDEMINQLIL